MFGKRTDSGPGAWIRDHGWLLATCVTFVILLAITVQITSRDESTNLENGLLQFILFAAGVMFSFYSGRQTVRATTQEVLRPHGTKSVRRLLTLLAGIQTFSVVIDQERIAIEDAADPEANTVSLAAATHSFNVIQSHIPGEIRTVGDALEDWRDVVPEQVDELMREQSPDV